MRVLFLMNRCAWIDIYHCHLVSARSSDALCSRCRFSGCVCGAASITSLKRGNIDHSDAADSFCAGCLIGVDRVAAARRAAFLRRKYVTRRLRLIRARSCCPMALYGLKIAETQSALQPIVLFLRTISRAQRRRLGDGS